MTLVQDSGFRIPDSVSRFQILGLGKPVFFPIIFDTIPSNSARFNSNLGVIFIF